MNNIGTINEVKNIYNDNKNLCDNNKYYVDMYDLIIKKITNDVYFKK